MVYYKSEIITIDYIEDQQLVRTEWQGFANSEEYRQVLEIYLQLVREKNVTRWVANNSHAKAIRPTDQEWTAKEWAPQFSKEGNLRRMAVVLPQDIFNKMAVDNILIKSSDIIKFETRYFSDEPSSLEWVLEEPE